MSLGLIAALHVVALAGGAVLPFSLLQADSDGQDGAVGDGPPCPGDVLLASPQAAEVVQVREASFERPSAVCPGQSRARRDAAGTGEHAL
jgi:hypothetical protein